VEIAGLILAAIGTVIAILAAGAQLLNWLHRRWSERQKIESDRERLEEILTRLAEDRKKRCDNGEQEG
jgi:uncharacterized membrane protein YccC